jgi:hypothetical protein
VGGPEVFGIAPDALNDDRIGRALDAMASELDRIVGSVGARAIAVFGIDVARLHWDMTSVWLYGAYEELEAGFAQPRWGRPKDRRPDLKQVQTGLAVAGDGGVPVWHRAYDGGAGEVAQVVGAMTALRELAGERGLLLVGDSKLVSRGNILAMNTARVAFIAPAAKPYLPAAQLRVLDLAAARPADYLAERDRGSPPGQRGSYRVVEGGITLRGKRKAEPDLAGRCVFVWSSARAQAAARSRAKSWTAPVRTCSAWSEGWVAATTARPSGSTSAFGCSRPAARSPATCRPRPAPTRPPASPLFPGPLTRPRWTPRRPPTAGMGC